jgi:Trk K+ transport system NAD-binding subunit
MAEASRVVEDLAGRAARSPHDGSDALQDLYEKLLDAALIVEQALIERDEPVPGKVLADLRAEIQRKDDLIAEFRRQREPLLRSGDTLRAERQKLFVEVGQLRAVLREHGLEGAEPYVRR